MGVGEGDGDGDGEGDGDACGCGSPICADPPKVKRMLSHKNAQNAQKIFLKHFVFFVLLCGLISSSRRDLVSVLR